MQAYNDHGDWEINLGSVFLGYVNFISSPYGITFFSPKSYILFLGTG